MQQVLLEGNGNGRFATGRETREPDCETSLFAQGAAFFVGDRARVPGDVAVGGKREPSFFEMVGGGDEEGGCGGQRPTYVAIAVPFSDFSVEIKIPLNVEDCSFGTIKSLVALLRSSLTITYLSSICTCCWVVSYRPCRGFLRSRHRVA